LRGRAASQSSLKCGRERAELIWTIPTDGGPKMMRPTGDRVDQRVRGEPDPPDDARDDFETTVVDVREPSPGFQLDRRIGLVVLLSLGGATAMMVYQCARP
jgi:hypothetical protein